jgi:hypothetical protein
MADGTPYPGFHRVFSYVERGYYGRQLARALALFPREQLFLLGSTELRRAPTATIAALCQFLGIAPPAGEVASRISRPAADIDYPATLSPKDVTFLQRQFADELVRFQTLSSRTIAL